MTKTKEFFQHTEESKVAIDRICNFYKKYNGMNKSAVIRFLILEEDRILQRKHGISPVIGDVHAMGY